MLEVVRARTIGLGFLIDESHQIKSLFGRIEPQRKSRFFDFSDL